MIPEFEADTGNLPPGVYAATWDELLARFGHTPWRRELLTGLELVVRALQQAGCRRVYLDGSFVTDKERIHGQPPADFDGCWDPAGVDPVELLRVALSLLQDTRWPRAIQKATYRGEMFIADWPADPITGEAFLAYFQHDRNGRAKGIILLALGGTA